MKPPSRHYICFWGNLIMANVVASGSRPNIFHGVVIVVFLILAVLSLWFDQRDD